MQRRHFLRAAVLGAGTSVAFGFSVTRQAIAFPALPGPSPYGDLLAADANGIRLPDGFTSRVLARATETVTGTGHTWHSAPDGGACFADGDGWIYVSNSEVPLTGGASALKFNGAAEITDAYPILSGTTQNCSGGATPWNTWLSCEETDRGAVHETDPWGGRAAVRHPAMGLFKHEAAAVDPDRKVVYLTEDESDGCFYRFVPTTWEDMSAGTLQVLTEDGSGLAWADVPDPAATTARTREQVAAAKHFDGGEGAYYRAGTCYFTTKGDNRVWAYDAERDALAVAYDDDIPDPPLTGVDNITGTAAGDLYVAEDGGNMEICLITPDDVVAPFLRVEGQDGSELCGVAFSPAGDRLYFSSQRGTSGVSSGGITYEVTGPFRG
ncbi:PhoX family protein [Saccharopolyspora gloriosae]|uniref:Secreted PhoX family phosphatase n=1 Tax=Saccharopolyspora gloriosae TaxID=455344 RepID=A0A840NJ50_9PSEU|nr:secreted PhoX family phosphatase [Saccharopolyspora gloriosae]